jgi:drug/metabolite transporter (DMT)-like permease
MNSSKLSNIANTVQSNGVILMLLSATFVAVSIILVKVAGNDFAISYWLISLFQFSVGLFFIMTFFREKRKANWKKVYRDPWLMARGILGGFGIPLYNLCILELGAGRSTILSSSYPIFAALFAPLLLAELLKLRHILWGLVALGGICLMTGPESLRNGLNGYDALAVAVAIASGVIVTIIRKLHTTYNTATIYAAQCLFGAIICLPGSLLHMSMPSLNGWFFLIGAALFVNISHITMTQGFRHISVAKGSSLHLLTPVLVTGASIILLGESFTTLDIIGGTTIVLSCLFIINDRWGIPLKKWT